MTHGFDCAEKKDRLTEILRALEAWSDPQHAQRPRMGAGDAGKHRLVIIEEPAAAGIAQRRRAEVARLLR